MTGLLPGALVLTVSDGVIAGTRPDKSGPVLAELLEAAGFQVERAAVPDDAVVIAAAVRAAAVRHRLVVTTGGTGMTPRDVTPQALRPLLDYEVPGFGELMRSEGRRSTPFATLSRDALTILLLIGGVVTTELVAEAFRLARYGDPDSAWEVVSELLARPLGTLAPEFVEVLFALAWWANVLIVCFFLVYLPRSKHLHIATAFFNTTLRKLKPRGELPAMDLEAETARFGVKSIEDLGWKDLLDGFTCTECGRCQAACPAWATGKPLNPKTLIMGLREMAVEAEHGVGL